VRDIAAATFRRRRSQGTQALNGAPFRG
jgi:hypothetical protein